MRSCRRSTLGHVNLFRTETAIQSGLSNANIEGSTSLSPPRQHRSAGAREPRPLFHAWTRGRFVEAEKSVLGAATGMGLR